MKTPSQLIALTFLFLVASPLFAQKEASQKTPAQSQAAMPSWARIILHKDFAGIWKNAELAYEVGRAFGEIAGGEMTDFITTAAGMPEPGDKDAALLTPENIEARFGPPIKKDKKEDTTWYDYGHIGFGRKNGDKHFSQLMAQRGFFVGGFVKVTNKTIETKKDQTEGNK